LASEPVQKKVRNLFRFILSRIQAPVTVHIPILRMYLEKGRKTIMIAIPAIKAVRTKIWYPRSNVMIRQTYF